jgi:hypothetical protein
MADEEASDPQQPPAPVNRGHSIHDAVKQLEAFYPGQKLPWAARKPWWWLQRASRGRPETDYPNDEVMDAAVSLSSWAEDELVRRSAHRSGRRPRKGSKTRGSRLQIIAALIAHHRYEAESCTNQEPIGVKELGRHLQLSPSVVSEFFKKEFGGHRQYQGFCRDVNRLIGSLKLLSGEYSPDFVYGRQPPGEREFDAE